MSALGAIGKKLANTHKGVTKTVTNRSKGLVKAANPFKIASKGFKFLGNKALSEIPDLQAVVGGVSSFLKDVGKNSSSGKEDKTTANKATGGTGNVDALVPYLVKIVSGIDNLQIHSIDALDKIIAELRTLVDVTSHVWQVSQMQVDLTRKSHQLDVYAQRKSMFAQQMNKNTINTGFNQAGAAPTTTPQQPSLLDTILKFAAPILSILSTIAGTLVTIVSSAMTGITGVLTTIGGTIAAAIGALGISAAVGGAASGAGGAVAAGAGALAGGVGRVGSKIGKGAAKVGSKFSKVGGVVKAGGSKIVQVAKGGARLAGAVAIPVAIAAGLDQLASGGALRKGVVEGVKSGSFSKGAETFLTDLNESNQQKGQTLRRGVQRIGDYFHHDTSKPIDQAQNLKPVNKDIDKATSIMSGQKKANDFDTQTKAASISNNNSPNSTINAPTTNVNNTNVTPGSILTRNPSGLILSTTGLVNF